MAFQPKDPTLVVTGKLTFSSAQDVELHRDAADTLAQRRGVNPQNLHIYNTFTDASNYERLEIGFSAGRFGVEATFAGTGTDKGLRLTGRDILFETNTVLRWQIDVGGSLLAISGGNIGALSAFRPSSIFVTTSVFAGLNNFAPIDAFILDSPDLIGVGTIDSHAVLWTGQGFDSGQHDADWKAFVDVTSNAAASTWTLQSRIDAVGFANRLQIDDQGNTTLNSAASLNWSTDVKLFRDDPWELALRDGVNANAFHIYKTFTDSSNFERLRIYNGGPSPVSFNITAESAGTGANDINLFLESAGDGRVELHSGTNILSFGQGIFDFTPIGVTSISGVKALFLREVNSQGTFIRMNTTTVLTSAGASVSASQLIPSNGFIIGVTTRVIQAITGAPSFDIGDGVNVDRWGAAISPGLGTITNINSFTSTVAEHSTVPGDVVFTSTGADFTGGEIRVTVHYIQLGGPSS